MTGQIGNSSLFNPCYILYDREGKSDHRSQVTAAELFPSSIEESATLNPAPATDNRPKSIRAIFDNLSSLYDAISSKIRSFIRLLFGMSDQEIASRKQIILHSLLEAVEKSGSPQDQGKIFIHLKFANRISLQFAYKPGSVSNTQIQKIAEKFFSDQFKADPYVKNYEFSVCSLYLMDPPSLNSDAMRLIRVASKICCWKNPIIKIFTSSYNSTFSLSTVHSLDPTSPLKEQHIALINQATHLDLAENDLFLVNSIIL